MVLGVRESNAIDKKPRYDCGRRDSRIKYRYDTMTRCLRVDPERESEQETRHQQVPITVFDVSFIILPSTNVVDDISIYIYPYRADVVWVLFFLALSTRISMGIMVVDVVILIRRLEQKIMNTTTTTITTNIIFTIGRTTTIGSGGRRWLCTKTQNFFP